MSLLEIDRWTYGFHMESIVESSTSSDQEEQVSCSLHL